MITMNRRRIVITGLGILSPLGKGTNINWSRILNGESAITSLPHDFFSSNHDVPVKIVGQINKCEKDGWSKADIVKKVT